MRGPLSRNEPSPPFLPRGVEGEGSLPGGVDESLLDLVADESGVGAGGSTRKDNLCGIE